MPLEQKRKGEKMSLKPLKEILSKHLVEAREKKGIEAISCLLGLIFYTLFDAEFIKRNLALENDLQFGDKMARKNFIILFFESQIRKNKDLPKKEIEKQAFSSLDINSSLSNFKNILKEAEINFETIRNLLLASWKEEAYNCLLSLKRKDNPDSKESEPTKRGILSFLARQTLSFLERGNSSPEKIGTTREYLESFLIS